MKILVINPFGATEPNAKENLEKVARSDVELDVVNISDVFPLDYNTYQYNVLKCANATVERIIKAEKEGWDAVVISCMADPGLIPARAAVDIPVAATFEASTHFACMVGQRFSIIAPDPVAADLEFPLADLYGVRQKLASIRDIGIVANKLYPEITPPEELRRRTVEVGKRCVEEDRAEVLIPGCTILGAILTSYFGEGLAGDIPVPVIDPMIIALKTAEMMVDLKRAGYPVVSRVALYKKQPKEEFTYLRKWMKGHELPEHKYYIE